MKKILLLSGIVLFATAAVAQQGGGRGQPGMGPVAQRCQDDIVKFCPGKEHGSGAIRDCLEPKMKDLTAACQSALKTTGGGRR
jgi:hypothetical protein